MVSAPGFGSRGTGLKSLILTLPSPRYDLNNVEWGVKRRIQVNARRAPTPQYGNDLWRTKKTIFIYFLSSVMPPFPL